MAENASYDAYLQSGEYQSLGINELQENLSNYQKTDAELRAESEAQYKPTYDAQKLSYNQEMESTVLGYENQLRELNSTKDYDIDAITAKYNQSINDMYSTLTKRGLGRSSLVSTQGSYLQNAMGKEVSQKLKEYSASAASINANIALARKQAADSIQLLDANYATQIENRITELRNSNQTNYTNLMLQIAQLQQSGYQAYIDNINTQKQMELSQRELDNSIAISQEELKLKQKQLELSEKELENATALNESNIGLNSAQAAYYNKMAKGSSGGGSSGSNANNSGNSNNSLTEDYFNNSQTASTKATKENKWINNPNSRQNSPSKSSNAAAEKAKSVSTNAALEEKLAMKKTYQK